eukprot:1315091-Amorphochlora_amoeboformis.AAC.2
MSHRKGTLGGESPLAVCPRVMSVRRRSGVSKPGGPPGALGSFVAAFPIQIRDAIKEWDGLREWKRREKGKVRNGAWCNILHGSHE